MFGGVYIDCSTKAVSNIERLQIQFGNAYSIPLRVSFDLTLKGELGLAT